MHTNYILVDPDNQTTLITLAEQQGWNNVYESEAFVVIDDPDYLEHFDIQEDDHFIAVCPISPEFINALQQKFVNCSLQLLHLRLSQ